MKKTTDQEFISPIAEQLCEAMAAAMVEFTARKKGQEFRAIVFSIAETFREDRAKILFTFFPDQTQKKVQGGGANIIRPQDEKRKGSSAIVPCDGCPGSAGFVVAQQQRESIADKTPETKRQSFTINPDQNPFKSVEDIMDRFENKPMAMRAFCQDKGIELHPSITKTRTIAIKIWDHYNRKKDEKQ